VPFRWSHDRNPFFLPGDTLREQSLKEARVMELINAYRVRGHLIADIDPLHALPVKYHPELDIETYGLTIWDLDREFITDGLANRESATLREILDILQRAYCGQGRRRVSPHPEQGREELDSRTDPARVRHARADSRSRSRSGCFGN
jgi:2-oxoglutarate dehydrogenase E1 component